MSVGEATSFHFLERSPYGVRPKLNRFRSGVSLHSHTMFSEESLDFLPRYSGYLRKLISRWQAEYSAKSGREFDFNHAFWTPPHNPRQANRLEQKQIQEQLELPALISLTDHDNTRAVETLRLLNQFSRIPVSMEWTVPFGLTFFHLGIHNIGSEAFRQLRAEMNLFTANPRSGALAALLARLNADPEVLVALNHPLWDEKGVGSVSHRQALRRLIEENHRTIHALEVNGLRSWGENKEVIAVARLAGLPVVSGGDRHGSEPNAILNLSHASSFAGFVEEVRYCRSSHVVFMPQYREPLKARILQTIVDVMRSYPENIEGRRLWSDRVFYRDPLTGETSALISIWKDGPSLVKLMLKAMRLLDRRSVRSVIRIALENGSLVGPDSDAAI